MISIITDNELEEIVKQYKNTSDIKHALEHYLLYCKYDKAMYEIMLYDSERYKRLVKKHKIYKSVKL